MSLEVVPFTEEYLEDAARLLASRHRADRKREPDLPAQFEDAAATARVLQHLVSVPAAGPGVAALREGRLAGYLLSILDLDGDTRVARIFLPGHASELAEAGETYRDMYTAIAPRWLANGCFVHFVQQHANDEQAVDTWVSLGFGQRAVHTLRDTSHAPGAVAEVEIRRARPEDIDLLLRLDWEFSRYFATSPMFLPVFGPERTRQFWEERLADPATPCWLAYRDGEGIAFMILGVEGLSSMLEFGKMVRIGVTFTDAAARQGGVGTALLNHSLDWARSQGYDHCLAGFVSTNILARRFWLGKGFRPVMLGLLRRIDERVAWADGRQGP